MLIGHDDKDHQSTFRPSQPREKWQKKRTSVKLKNVIESQGMKRSTILIFFIFLSHQVTANHRANDVIVREGQSNQRLQARFMYGPLDMITLAGTY